MTHAHHVDPTIIDVVGLDAAGNFSPDAEPALRSAQRLIGSPRQLNLIAHDISPEAQRVAWPSPLLPALSDLFPDPADASDSLKKTVVLASGDPLFHGIGATLRKRFPKRTIRVYPYMSSFTIACARMGWATHETECVSLVTAPVEAIIPFCDAGQPFIVLARSRDSVTTVAHILDNKVTARTRISVLSDIGTDTERITHGTAAHPPHADSDLCVLAITPVHDAADSTPRSLCPGLADENYDHDGQLTKSDIRAITVCALAPRPGEILWDIGGGSGSISIEWCRVHPRNSAVCVEKNPERAQRIRDNARTLGASNVHVVEGTVPDVLNRMRQDYGTPHAIFIGGGLTSGCAAELIDLLRVPGRLIANGVTVESQQILSALRKEYGGSLRRLHVESEHSVGKFLTLKPTMPVLQWRYSVL